MHPIVPTVYLNARQTEEEWRDVFLVTAAVYAVGALLYGLLASGEKQVPPMSSSSSDYLNTCSRGQTGRKG